jgi:hypothetical protein
MVFSISKHILRSVDGTNHTFNIKTIANLAKNTSTHVRPPDSLLTHSHWVVGIFENVGGMFSVLSLDSTRAPSPA